MPPLVDSSRSSPSDSTLSCITVIQDTGVSSDSLESTPPTSVTDSASVLSIKDSTAPASRRVSRNSTGVTSYNENMLSKATRPIPRSPANTKTVLGKRGRDSVGKGTNKKRRVSRRLIEVEKQKHVVQESPKKQTRQAVTEAKEEEIIKLQPVKKPRVTARSKKYLAQGLYVGQDPNFDPRFTEEKNKRKLAAKGGIAAVAPQRTVLPELMFAGKRLVDQGRGFRLPFNVCSPLPPGQSRPDEWRKTQKNVFVGDAADFWRTSKRMEHSTCLCEPDAGCDEHCLNRYMFYECDSSNCNVGAGRCGNRAFEDLRKRVKAGGKFNVGVDVIKTQDRGYGVRSNRCFEPNQIIMEYTGEIITQDECDDRMRNRYKDNECFYLMMFDQNMIIDATRGSIARFVNHSCEPNCRMEKWTVAGKPRMALFAGDDGIYTGEELAYDYNFDPFSSGNMTECRCGSAQCRGVLGPRSKDGPAPSVTGMKRKGGPEAGSPQKKRKTEPASQRKGPSRKAPPESKSKSKSQTKSQQKSKAAPATRHTKQTKPTKNSTVSKVTKRTAPAPKKAARAETQVLTKITIPSPSKVRGSNGRKSAAAERMEPKVVVKVAATSSAGTVSTVQASIGQRQTTLAFSKNGGLGVTRGSA